MTKSRILLGVALLTASTAALADPVSLVSLAIGSFAAAFPQYAAAAFIAQLGVPAIGKRLVRRKCEA